MEEKRKKAFILLTKNYKLTKTKNYEIKKTNTLLGIIAINLTLLTLIQLEIWPTKANATELNSNLNYGLVPLNADGSINVNLTSSTVEAMDVNLKAINGYQPWISTKNGAAILGVYSQSATLN